METPRTKVKRAAGRGAYDRETIYHILDEGLICHVGIEHEGQPFVIPTIHARSGHDLLLHGSPGSRLVRHIVRGGAACVTVTLLDGLVLARSVFHHSMNYRCVVILGHGENIADPEQKKSALRVISQHLMPGRWDEAREPSEAELKQTAVVRIPIEEGSAKVRTGPPVDENEDYALPVWAGVVPLRLTAGAPQADPALTEGRQPSHHVTAWPGRGTDGTA